jgi:thiamine pyrophosphate-dependent acetolactate synthase large subunit-like protein
MRDIVARYLSRKHLSRRGFMKALLKTGMTAAAAESVIASVSGSLAVAQEAGDGAAKTTGGARAAASSTGGRAAASGGGVAGVKMVQDTGGACLAEQLIASGVKYVFGNCASEDAEFYDALVDRPQLKYILTPHEGPGAAMAAGYVKASGEPALVMQAGVVGLMNAMGQFFNAYKEQTPLVFYSYRADDTPRAGRDGFEELMNQEQIVQPMSKYTWLARGADQIPETVRRAFKAAWTPAHGPTYISWHKENNTRRTRAEIIDQKLVDPRMRVRPNPVEVERAAKLLVEAKMPLMLVGDEVTKAKAVEKAVKLAELLGMPVTQARQIFANFPETHPLYVGSMPAGQLASVDWPKNPDVVINVGNKMQHSSGSPIVPRRIRFIDMRIDSTSMGNVITTEVPLVADVGYGLDDLITAIESMLTPKLKETFAARAVEVRKASDKLDQLRALVVNNPEWDNAPLIADRLTWEIAQFADPNAIIVHEAGSVALHSFDFNPIGGRELMFYYGGHLGSGVGTSAGVKLARPNQQVICLVGDGSFVFGPTALWNMARLELPVIVVVYNNHAYSGPHSRSIGKMSGSRMVETGQFYADYLGSPDMNMASIAAGFGVKGEVVANPAQLKQALARAKAATVEGKPYLLDVQVARRGIGWTDKPWVPPISIAAERTRKV